MNFGLIFPLIDYPKVNKAWGTEYILVNNKEYCAKILRLHPDCSSSYHFHRKKHETFIILSGTLWVEVERKKRKVTVGDKITLAPKTKHRFYGAQDFTDAYILEVSTHHSDDDVVRLSKSKGTSKVFVDNTESFVPSSVRMLGV